MFIYLAYEPSSLDLIIKQAELKYKYVIMNKFMNIRLD